MFLQKLHPFRKAEHEKRIKPDPHQVALAFGRRASSKLVDLLHAEGLPTENLVEALGSLLELLKAPKRAVEVISLNAAAFCLGNMGGDNDSRVRALSGDVLAVLCNLVPGRRSLKKCDLGPLIACLGQDVEESVRSSAAKALETFSNSRDGASFLAEQDFVSEIVARGLWMGPGGDDSFPDKTVECIATALANICRYQDGLQRTFESDAVDKAKKLLLHSTAENPVPTGAEQATWTMLGALANDDDAKATCIEGGLVKLAADALERNVELAEGVIRFLLKISLCEAGKKAFVSDGVVRAVSTLLKSNIEYVRQEAKLTICGASEYPAAKREFVEAVLELGPDVVWWVYGESACPLLSSDGMTLQKFQGILSCLDLMPIKTIADNLYVSETLRRVAEEVFVGDEKQPLYDEIITRIVDRLDNGFVPPLLNNE